MLALTVLAGLLAVLASLVASQRVAMRAQANRVEAIRARRAAMSGVQRALTTLALIPQPGQSGQNGATNSTTPQSSNSASGATTLQDDWATLGQTGAENFRVGADTFRLQIVDSCSFLNINTATEDQLNLLPLTQDEIAAWLDYRTTNTDPRALGAKDEYYNNLADPYNAKLANFETVDELLQVKGFTPKMLYQVRTDVQTNNPVPTDQNGSQIPLSDLLTAYSYAPQLNPQGQAKANINSAPANQILTAINGVSPQVQTQILAAVQPGPGLPRQTFANMGAVLALAPNAADQQILLDNLTTTGATRRPGLININTASQAVLQCVPGITPDIASAIVQRQAQNGFASLGEVATIPGISGSALQQSADFLTATSQTFVIRVIGKAGDTSIALEALVDVQNGTPKLLQIHEPPFNDMLTRWNWPTDTTTETVLKERA